MRFLITFLAAVLISVHALVNPAGTLLATGKYIIRLHDVMQTDNFLVTLHDTVAKLDSASANVTHRWKHVNGFAGHFNPVVLDFLRHSPHVKNIEEDAMVHTTVTQNNAPWGISRLSSKFNLQGQDPSLLNYTYNYGDSAGSGVDVYVIDSGIRISHEDFGGRACWGATYGGYPDEDDAGHGTHTAGTIGGTQFGVAKATRLIAVKVLNAQGQGFFSDVISGIDFAHTSSISSGRPSVISMSLSGQIVQTVNDAVSAVVQAGIHCVVAAGNSAQDAQNSSPASAPGAIVVGATDIDDTIASFSNFGSLVTLFAPGVQITSCGIASDTATAVMTGTSMSAPHVSGLISYLLSQEPNSSPSDIKAKLQELATLSGGVVSVLPSGTTDLLAHSDCDSS